MGKLTGAKRNKMPSSDFALPGRGKGKSGKGSGSYPIPDKAHARDALARGAQHASSGELATIKRAVHRKFPGIKIKGAAHHEGHAHAHHDGRDAAHY
jgi:hypothetical protein